LKSLWKWGSGGLSLLELPPRPKILCICVPISSELAANCVGLPRGCACRGPPPTEAILDPRRELTFPKIPGKAAAD